MQAEQDDGSPALALIAAITAGDDPMTRAENAVRDALSAAQPHWPEMIWSHPRV
jgi:hypothetical protein